MSPIQRFVDPGNSNEYFVDLRRIVLITRYSSSDSSTIHMDPADHDLHLHDHVADKINEAWRAYNAPRPADAGPGLLELPHGWRWDPDVLPGHTAARSLVYDCGVLVDTDGEVAADSAPIDVVLAVIARARVGGAS